jgi:replicative DNA helicase
LIFLESHLNMEQQTLFNNSNYIELVIKCLFRDRNVLKKAIDLQIKPSDFGTIDLYRVFAETALAIGEAPINSKLCLATLKTYLASYPTLSRSQEDIVKFWSSVYDDEPTNADYILNNLVDFIKFRRYQQLKAQNISDPEQLIKQANQLVDDIVLRDKSEDVREFNPFQDLILITRKEYLITGFGSIDAQGKGLNYQELGLIIGHSGSGKTATAVFSAIQNARQNKKVLYLSLEEPGENICNRLYSNVFRLNYSNLHRACATTQDELQSAFETTAEADRNILSNLKVHDLRHATPLTAKYLKDYLDKIYETSGWHPDLVYIDQLDYITSSMNTDSLWQKYSNSIFEIDDLCNHLIGGRHSFSIWLLHQAAGRMSKTFSNSEISGFKGILKPVDLCLAIGRDNPRDKLVNIFSLKCRHSENFAFEYFAELEYMNFEEADHAAEHRIATEEQVKVTQRSSRGAFKNTPNKYALLPSTTSGFNSSY